MLNVKQLVIAALAALSLILSAFAGQAAAENTSMVADSGEQKYT